MEPVIELRNANIYHHETDGNVKPGGVHNNLILSGVNVTIGRGELVYLIGRVGSGKSSFLKTLYADLPLVEGWGCVAGYDLCTIRRKEIPMLRRRLGIVFQDYKLLGDRNVFENLRFVLRATSWKDERQIERRIDEVLTLVDLANHKHKMPFQMSGGEQQRLSVARALLNNPEVILADEPTGNLDHAAADMIMKIFISAIASTGCSVVMATHNITNIQNYPSRVLRFGQGRVEEIDVTNLFGRTAPSVTG